MKAWSESLDANKSSHIRFLADPSGAFARALDTEFDSAKVFGQNRSKRYAITIENGRVKDVYIEPDNTGVVGKPCNHLLSLTSILCYCTIRTVLIRSAYLVSAAEKVLG